ncbi:MAG: FCD domain-containing protein [Streptosporangiales bacterium]|nr:FCD domain-containing protein [Streptosporangiales bacterium]
MDDVSASGELRVAAVAAPLRAQVVRNLREAILNRTFQPGQRLVERELCELTGVSRTTVREALRQLESEGLVRLVANQGPIVAKMSLEEARDLYDVRGVLEALAASRFAATATDDQIRRLAEVTDRFEETVRGGELSDIVARKDELYAVLLEGANNPVVRQVLESLWGRIAYLRATSLRRPRRTQEVAGEVRKVVDAIVRRDADEAWTLSRWHVDRAAEAALEVLESEGG